MEGGEGVSLEGVGGGERNVGTCRGWECGYIMVIEYLNLVRFDISSIIFPSS